MVDDEKPYLDFLAAMLTTNLGWPIRTFNRPIDALAALPGLAPAVIVTDYFMPELNGFEFVRAAAQLCPGVPCIMISGHSLALADDPLAQASPLCAILHKPFGWRQLADEIMVHAPELSDPLDQAQPNEAPA